MIDRHERSDPRELDYAALRSACDALGDRQAERGAEAIFGGVATVQLRFTL